jgi:hypothetical protein
MSRTFCSSPSSRASMKQITEVPSSRRMHSLNILWSVARFVFDAFSSRRGLIRLYSDEYCKRLLYAYLYPIATIISHETLGLLRTARNSSVLLGLSRACSILYIKLLSEKTEHTVPYCSGKKATKSSSNIGGIRGAMDLPCLTMGPANIPWCEDLRNKFLSLTSP